MNLSSREWSSSTVEFQHFANAACMLQRNTHVVLGAESPAGHYVAPWHKHKVCQDDKSYSLTQPMHYNDDVVAHQQCIMSLGLYANVWLGLTELR